MFELGYPNSTWQNLRDGYREVSPFWPLEDARLILFARRAFADRKDRLSRLEELVRVAADKGSTSAMAEAREKILDLFGGAGGGR